MEKSRLKELMTEADNERLSYGEIVEIDAAAEQMGIEHTEEMTSIDVLLELEARLA